MKFTFAVATLTLVAILAFQPAAHSQPGSLPPERFLFEFQGAGKEKDKDKDKDKKPIDKKVESPFSEPLARLDRESVRGFTPHMLGDMFGVFAFVRTLNVGTQTTVTTPLNLTPPIVPRVTTGPAVQTRTFAIPYPVYGPFKVAENASPMPVDRVFTTFNFFNDVRDPRNGPTSQVATQTNRLIVPGVGAANVTTTTFFPGAPYVNVFREVFGFEKTFLDGRASVEVRVPVTQQPSGFDAFRSEHFGDVTVVSKYAFYLDRANGNVFSGGLAVTAPTGPSIDTTLGRIHSTLLQPWGGYIWNFDRFYVHGFHSVVIPTDSRDITLLFNDVGLGYRLYRGDPNRLISFIAPTFEMHVTTPLNHRSGNGATFVPDMVTPIGGVHIGLFRNATVSFGAGAPITGPRMYSFEAFTQFNLRF